MKKKKVTEPYRGPIWDVGTYVIVERPSVLWAGASGVVESVDAETGIHTVKINGKPVDGKVPVFRGEILGQHLRFDI